MVLTNQLQNWIINQIDPKASITLTKHLKGSTSSTLHLIKLKLEGEQREVVLRQFDNQEWLKEEPDLALHEAQSLSKATRVNVPTPSILAYDEKGEVCGGPLVLMSKVEGNVVLDDSYNQEWINGLAGTLAEIHKLNKCDFPWDYYPYKESTMAEVPTWSREPAAWQMAVCILNGSRPNYRECFIHRDYHPTNVLWKDGKVSGVVDWVNACLGPAGIDVAHCRVNLAMLYGASAADAFLTAYQNNAGELFEYNPYWDIASLNDILEGPPEVYPGWEAFGFTGLTTGMMKERLDQYLLSILDKVKG
ncbi:aminoglycoside phosphotransferase family protein [Oceanobacillus halophilus]|uniref:Aminoglycoside phosphotransferase family protein n=1 Tax=Oceanobacillus halophilus TaxID=930130 RepID=A0A495A1C4_9BACI|nr:aminoglycoside phosphotransferase family protein [Oceanobacillus halophilus]RKQ33241.1 aminoglycoside phosphotransferase family protein [Oceanobacillus halophilus]